MSNKVKRTLRESYTEFIVPLNASFRNADGYDLNLGHFGFASALATFCYGDWQNISQRLIESLYKGMDVVLETDPDQSYSLSLRITVRFNDFTKKNRVQRRLHTRTREETEGFFVFPNVPGEIPYVEIQLINPDLADENKRNFYLVVSNLHYELGDNLC